MSEKRDGISIGIIGTGRAAVELAANMHGQDAGDSSIAAACDPVSAPPTLKGERGRAWKLDLDSLRAHCGVAAENDGTLAVWMVEAPWAHPCWHSYEIVLVHLRPLPGQAPAIKYLSNATHELWVIALDPAKPRQRRLDGEKTGAWLSPLNFAAQMVELSDELALQRVLDAVHEIIAGTLSPDTDYLRAWTARFGDSMIRR